MIDLATERAGYTARLALETRARMARALLRDLGWNAEPGEIHRAAIERWQLDETEAAKVAVAAEVVRAEERATTRHLSLQEIEEDDVNQKEMAEKYRQATREALKRAPGLSRAEMYDRVKAEVGGPLKVSSWEVTYYYPIRKDLRENGTKPTEKRARRPNPALVSQKEEKEDQVEISDQVDLGMDVDTLADAVLRDVEAAKAEITAELAEGQRVEISRGYDCLVATEHGGHWRMTLHLELLEQDEFAKIIGSDPVFARILEF